MAGIVLENVTVVYDKQSGKIAKKPGTKIPPALADVSLRLQPGEFVAVLGSSGAGKSTLIRCLNLLVRPTRGRVLWNGKDLTTLAEKELRSIRTQFGMIFQQFHLVPRLSVLNNVLLGTLGKRAAWKNWLAYFSREEKERALEALRQVELADFAEKRVEHLSGGQQQRVAIARMLLQDPQVILGDEPVASLDPVISRNIMDLVRRIHESRRLITVMNLHDVGLAKRYATRIVGLSHGRVVFDGPPELVNEDVQQTIYGTQKKEPARR
ncbi:phosphonate ABC transporter ATP-binding protein [Bacillaceae bacterium]